MHPPHPVRGVVIHWPDGDLAGVRRSPGRRSSNAYVRGQPAGARALPGRRLLLGHLPAHRLDAAMVHATGRLWLRGGRTGDLSPCRARRHRARVRRRGEAPGTGGRGRDAGRRLRRRHPRGARLARGRRPRGRRRPPGDGALHRRSLGLPRRVRPARARRRRSGIRPVCTMGSWAGTPTRARSGARRRSAERCC